MFGFLASIWKFLKKHLGTNSKKKPKEKDNTTNKEQVGDKIANTKKIIEKSTEPSGNNTERSAPGEISNQPININTNLENEKSIDEKLKELANSLKNKKLGEDNQKKILNAAKYLYENGYQAKGVLDFLDQGGFNTVFRIRGTDTVVKYCKPGRKNPEISADEMSIRVFEDMVKKTEDEKLKKWAKKYLPNIKRINNKDIYEDSLGISDLLSTAQNRENKRNTSSKKSLDSLLKIAKRATKAIKVFHDNGYIHQDIKLENILKISNPKYLDAIKVADKNEYLKDDKGLEYCVVSKKIKKNGIEKIQYFKKYKNGEMKNKITKNTINIIDVGLMRKIEDLLNLKKGQIAGTDGYVANDSIQEMPRNSNDIKKWDVYALGITFYALLCGSLPMGKGRGLELTVKLSGFWPTSLSSKVDDLENFREFYKSKLKKIYSQDQFNRIYYFMKLINLMTIKRDDRILLDEVLEKLKFIMGVSLYEKQ